MSEEFKVCLLRRWLSFYSLVRTSQRNGMYGAHCYTFLWDIVYYVHYVDLCRGLAAAKPRLHFFPALFGMPCDPDDREGAVTVLARVQGLDFCLSIYTGPERFLALHTAPIWGPGALSGHQDRIRPLLFMQEDTAVYHMTYACVMMPLHGYFSLFKQENKWRL